MDSTRLKYIIVVFNAKCVDNVTDRCHEGEHDISV